MQLLCACPAARDALHAEPDAAACGGTWQRTPSIAAALALAAPPSSANAPAAQPPPPQAQAQAQALAVANTGPGLLLRAVRLIEAENAPLAARRGVLAALNTCVHSGWASWPSAVLSCRAASRMAAGALAELRPRGDGAIAAHAPAPTPLARECLLLIGFILSDRATSADASAELGGDPAAAQRALAAAAAALESPDSHIRRLGKHLADRVVAYTAAAEAAEAHA